jgi:hypothetical protein
MSILTHVSSVPDQRRSSFTSPFHDRDAFPAKRRVGFPPPVPTRSHDHRLRFTVPAHWPDFNSADLPFGRGAHARFGRCAPLLDSACSLMACNLGLCCVHSFGSRADRSPPEGASCATMSSHTGLLSNIEKFPLPIWGSMFPFWNPTGVFPRSVTPTRRKGHDPLVVCCFLSIQRPPGVNEGEATPGPTWPGALGLKRPKRRLGTRTPRESESAYL